MNKSTNIAIIDFYGDELVAIANDNGKYVAIKPICDSLGLGWSSQLKRLKRDTILSENTIMMTTPFNPNGQEMVGLEITFVNGWLLSIDESRVKDDFVKEKVLRYKRECYKVLFEHFNGRQVSNEMQAPDRADVMYIECGTIKIPLQEFNSKLRAVDTARQIYGIKYAQELWKQLELPVAMMARTVTEQDDLFLD